MEKDLRINIGFRRFILITLVVALLLAALISPFVSTSPDGLEKVAGDKGFLNTARILWRYSPLPDYSLSVIENKYISTGLAGIIGVVLVFITTRIIAKKIIKKKD